MFDLLKLFLLVCPCVFTVANVSMGSGCRALSSIRRSMLLEKTSLLESGTPDCGLMLKAPNGLRFGKASPLLRTYKY